MDDHNNSDSDGDPHAQHLVIEKILTEDRDVATGKMKYLLKLSSLPLHQATWAFREDFDDGQILRAWEERKQLEQRDEAVAFDINQYTDAVSRYYQRQGESRAKKRAAQQEERRLETLAAFQGRVPKRRMHSAVSDSARQDALPDEGDQTLPPENDQAGSRNDDDDHDPSDGDNINVAVRPLWSQAVAEQSTTKESQGLRKEKEKTSVSTGQQQGAAPKLRQDIDVETALRQVKTRSRASQALQASNSDRSAPQAVSSKGTMMSGRSRSRPREADGSGTSSSKDKPSQVEPDPQASHRTASATTRSATRSVLANWDASRPEKRKRASSGEVPKDSNRPCLFSRLSIQNNFQKHVQAERTPDINALQMIDPKTGKTMPSTTCTVGNSAKEIPRAYQRTPPRERPPRSPSLPPDEAPSEKPAPNGNVASAQRLYADPQQPARMRVCWAWQASVCQYTLQQCSFAHFEIDENTRPPDFRRRILHGDITCSNWKRERSCYRRVACDYAHEDTGIYIPSSRINLAAAEPTPKQTEGIIMSGRPTCRYWKEGYCYRGASCLYPHYDTGMTAAECSSKPLPSASRIPSNDNAWPGSWQPSSVSDSAAQTLADHKDGEAVESVTEPSLQRRDSMPLPVRQSTMTIHFDGADQPVQLRVHLECPELEPSAAFAGSSHNVSVLGSIMAADLKHLLEHKTTHPDGLLASGRMTFDTASGTQAKELIALCNVHKCGLLAESTGSDSILVIYTEAQEQDVHTMREHDKISAPNMRFRFIQKPSTIDASALATSEVAIEPMGFRRTVTSLGQGLSVLNVKRFFPAGEKTIQNTAVFLMIPLEYHDEMEMCVRFFTSLECKIYTSSTPGAWSYFRQTRFRSCLVIVHPDIPLYKVPGLHVLLANTGGDVRVFSLGIHEEAAILEARPPRYECIRLFPHGSVYYITDEVFMQYPKEALRLIQTYNEKHRSKPHGGENNRIAARPGLMTWLFSKLANTEHGRPEIHWLHLYEAFSKLCDPTGEGYLDFEKPLPTSCNLISELPENLPSFQRLSSEPGDDELAATDWMIHWFAGWSLMHVTQFRKFIVCHATKEVEAKSEMVWNETGRLVVGKAKPTDVDPRGWAKAHQHIGVLSPEECIKLVAKKL